MKFAIIGAALIVAISVGAYTFAQGTANTSVEVRVWQRSNDLSAVFVSARPDGGSWRDLGTIPLAMDQRQGAFLYSDIELDVAIDVPNAPPPEAGVFGEEVRCIGDGHFGWPIIKFRFTPSRDARQARFSIEMSDAQGRPIIDSSVVYYVTAGVPTTVSETLYAYKDAGHDGSVCRVSAPRYVD